MPQIEQHLPFVKKRLVGQANESPLLLEQIAIENSILLKDFLLSVPEEHRRSVWLVLIECLKPLADGDWLNKQARKDIVNKLSSVVPSRELKKFSKKFLDASETYQLLMSDAVLSLLGCTKNDTFANFSAQLPIDLPAKYIESIPEYDHDYVLITTANNPTGALSIQERMLGMCSELTVRTYILEPLKTQQDPFKSLADAEFIKLSLLCKVHHLLDGQTILNQILRTLIFDRAQRLKVPVPKFIQVLKNDQLNLADPLLETLKLTSVTTLARTLAARNELTASSDMLHTMSSRSRTGRFIQGDFSEQVDVLKQRRQIAAINVHKWSSTYEKQLLQAITYLTPDTQSKNRAVSQGKHIDLQRFLARNPQIASQIKHTLEECISFQTVTTNVDAFPVSEKFVTKIKTSTPTLYSFLTETIKIPDAVELTSFICLSLIHLENLKKTNSDTNFLAVYSKFEQDELSRKQKTSLVCLSQSTKNLLQNELDTVSVSFDPHGSNLHLTMDSGVITYSSKEIQDLNQAMIKMINFPIFSDEKLLLTGSANLTFGILFALALVYLDIKLDQFTPKQIELVRSLSYGALSSGLNWLQYMLRSMLPFFPKFLNPKYSKLHTSLEHVRSEKKRMFTRYLYQYIFTFLFVAAGHAAFYANKEAIYDLLDDVRIGISESDIGNLVSKEIPDLKLGNNVDQENAGKPEYRIFPYNFSGYVTDGLLVYLNEGLVLKEITTNTTDFQNEILLPKALTVEHFERYQDNQSVFDIADEHNIDLETNQQFPDALIIQKTSNLREFPNVVGYIVDKIIFSDTDYWSILSKHLILWSPYFPLTVPQTPRDPVYIIYRKLGLNDRQTLTTYLDEYHTPSVPPTIYLHNLEEQRLLEGPSLREETTLFNQEVDHDLILTDAVWSKLTNPQAEVNAGFNIYKNQYLASLPPSEMEKLVATTIDLSNYLKLQYPNIKITLNTGVDEVLTITLPWGFKNATKIEPSIFNTLTINNLSAQQPLLELILPDLETIRIIPHDTIQNVWLVVMDGTSRQHLNYLQGSASPALFSISIDTETANSLVDAHVFPMQELSPPNTPEVQLTGRSGQQIGPISAEFSVGDIGPGLESWQEIKGMISSDPELSYLLEILKAMPYTPTIEQKLDYFKSELEKRGLNYDAGNDTFAGSVNGILEMLRIDPKTGLLQYPDQVCNGMASMVYFIAKLNGLEVALMQVNVKPSHTSYSGNSNNDHMVLVYREEHAWYVYEATLPDYDQSVDLQQLPAESLGDFPDSGLAESSEPSTATAIALTGVILGGLVGLQRVAQKKFGRNKLIEQPPSAVQDFEFTDPKISGLISPLVDHEKVFLARILEHCDQKQGRVKSFSRSKGTSENGSSEIQAILHQAFVELAMQLLVEYEIKMVPSSSLAQSSVQSVILPELQMLSQTGRKFGLFSRLKAKFAKNNTELNAFVQYKQLIKDFKKQIEVLADTKLPQIVDRAFAMKNKGGLPLRNRLEIEAKLLVHIAKVKTVLDAAIRF